MKPSLLGHWKLDRLAELLQVPIPHAIGILELLWLHTARLEGEDKFTGRLASSPEDIAAQCRWIGDGQALINALRRAKFIDEHDGELFIHDWHEHRPRYVDLAEKRARKGSDDDEETTASNAGRTRPRTDAHVRTSAHANDHVRTPAHENPLLSSSLLSSSGNTENPPVSASALTSPNADASASSPGEGLSLSGGDPLPSARKRWPNRQSDIDAIYGAYPRKVGKDAARKAIGKAAARIAREREIAESEAAAWLIGRVRAYAQSAQVRSLEAQGKRDKIPHPSTWFNEGRWADDDAEWAATDRPTVAGTIGVNEPGWKSEKRETGSAVRAAALSRQTTGPPGPLEHRAPFTFNGTTH